MNIRGLTRALRRARPNGVSNATLQKNAPTPSLRSTPALVSPRCLGMQAGTGEAGFSGPNVSDASNGSTNTQDASTLDLNDIRPAANALRSWKDRYQKCIVPKSLATDDAKYLVKIMKFLRRNKDTLSDDQIETLTEAGMVWEVPSTVESKWWSNFHAAKAFLDDETDETRIRDFLNHEMADPHPFQDGSADQIEASRWLGRQRVLYRRQKLTLMQVHLLKRVLPGVRLVRQRGPARRNKHEVIRAADEAWKRQADAL